MGTFTDILKQAGGGIIGAGMGMVMGGYNDRRQIEQQRKLQEMQLKGNMQMADYNMQKQLQMWHETNYSAQIEEMKKAGINPGLLYGISGGGGTTTGNPGGAGASGATATQGGAGEVMGGMGMGIQMAMTQALIEKTKAETKNIETNTVKTGGVDTKEAETRIASLTQGITNAKAQEKIMGIEAIIKDAEAQVKTMTIEDSVDYIAWQTGKALEEMQQAETETFIKRATQHSIIDTIRAQMIGAFLNNALTKAQTGKTTADTKLSTQEWQQNIEKLVLQWREDEREGREVKAHERAVQLLEYIKDVPESSTIGIKVAEELIDGVMRAKTGTHSPIKGFRR